jgi:hypothetical protein
MKAFFSTLILSVFFIFFQNCSTPEERPYQNPKQSIRVLFLPFIEEAMIQKSFEEKKKSPHFGLGAGFSENLAQFFTQRDEFVVVDARKFFEKNRLEQYMSGHQETNKTIKTIPDLEWIVTGSYQFNSEKNQIDLNIKIYDSQSNLKASMKGKKIEFTEAPDSTDEKKDKVIYYNTFIKDTAYTFLAKTILCEGVARENCSPLNDESFSAMKLEEVLDLQAYRSNYQGVLALYESYSMYLGELDRQKMQNKALAYFNRAIMEAKKRNRFYMIAMQNRMNLVTIIDDVKMEMDLELKSYGISSYNYPKEPLRNALTQTDLERLRKVFYKALRFVKLNPDFRLEVLGYWSKEKSEHLDMQAKNARSNDILDKLFLSVEDREVYKGLILFEDRIGDEDMVEFGITKEESEQGGN